MDQFGMLVQELQLQEEQVVVEQDNKSLDRLPGVDITDDYVSEKKEVERLGNKLGYYKWMAKEFNRQYINSHGKEHGARSPRALPPTHTHAHGACMCVCVRARRRAPRRVRPGAQRRRARARAVRAAGRAARRATQPTVPMTTRK